ncbi:MAG: hypothetical protein WA373_07140 [Burkholderiales bacterium]
MALIDDPQVIRRILEHPGQWAPQASERSSPLNAGARPVRASLPLTCPPVPGIA